MKNRFIYLLLLVSFFYLTQIEAEEKKKICLNMIVKNESEVIRRCLSSVKPIIDHWIIVDTGSTDGTQEIIREFMKDIPGTLYERPWIDFAHNRNEALNLVDKNLDYILFIDADEVLVFEKDFKLPVLTKDFYYIQTNFANTLYNRIQLINNHLNWKWIGVLHETVNCDQAKSCDTLKHVINLVRTDGARSKDPKKFQKDAEVLEKALLTEPTNQRYVFYLAQSYRDAQLYEPAIKNYEKRVAMKGWDQEVFWSLLQIGILQEELKLPSETVVESYTKAYNYRPSRAEPLYRLAHFYRQSRNFQAGYETARKGLTLPISKDILFVERWIYDHGLPLEFSICAYELGKYTEALLASQLILARSNIPSNVRTCVQNNLVWIHSKLKEFDSSQTVNSSNSTKETSKETSSVTQL